VKEKHKKAYMECAEAFAKCSLGARLQVGAVLVKGDRVISCGYNALPKHIDGPLEKDGVTRSEVLHAEANALRGLIRSTESAVGAVLFCTHSCCVKCAIDVVDSGIIQVFYRHEYRDSAGVEYLSKNGVKVTKI